MPGQSTRTATSPAPPSAGSIRTMRDSMPPPASNTRTRGCSPALLPPAEDVARDGPARTMRSRRFAQDPVTARRLEPAVRPLDVDEGVDHVEQVRLAARHRVREREVADAGLRKGR